MENDEKVPEEIRNMRCPYCNAKGTLRTRMFLRAKPLGTWSLSGTQLKTSAEWWPYLICTADGCDYEEAGKIE